MRSLNQLPRRRWPSFAVGMTVVMASLVAGTSAGAPNAAADRGSLQVKSESGKTVISSSAGSTWQAVIDPKRGGVITGLHIPADGPNLVSDDGGRFEGLCNLLYVDFKETGKDESGYLAKGTLYYHSTGTKVATVAERPDCIVVDVSGRSGNQSSPKADVIRYRQRYTFTADRIVCDGELEWLFDDVVPGSHPELIQLYNFLATDAVTGAMRVWDEDTGSMPLPETSSKGRNYPEGIDYPITVEAPLRGGHALRFHSLRMPADFVQARFYWSEYRRKHGGKHGFAFKAWEGWRGNGTVRFPNDRPIPYQYEIIIVPSEAKAASEPRGRE